GGVVVTYFEWVQNNQGYYWSEEKVEKKLNNIMTNAFEKIYHTSQIRKVDMRLASHMVGVRKMAEASRYRGWVQNYWVKKEDIMNFEEVIIVGSGPCGMSTALELKKHRINP